MREVASQHIPRPDVKNSIEEINHLYRRLFKELYRISGGTVDGCRNEYNEMLFHNIFFDIRLQFDTRRPSIHIEKFKSCV